MIRGAGTTRDGKTIDLAEYLRRHRDRFVLKPNDEYGGTGVTLGWETDEPRVGRGDCARARRVRSRMDRAGAHRHPPRDVSRLRARRHRRARHASWISRRNSVPRAVAGFLTG